MFIHLTSHSLFTHHGISRFKTGRPSEWQGPQNCSNFPTRLTLFWPTCHVSQDTWKRTMSTFFGVLGFLHIYENMFPTCPKIPSPSRCYYRIVIFIVWKMSGVTFSAADVLFYDFVQDFFEKLVRHLRRTSFQSAAFLYTWNNVGQRLKTIKEPNGWTCDSSSAQWWSKYSLPSGKLT